MDGEERTGYRSGDPKRSSAGGTDPKPAPQPATSFLCDLCGSGMLDRHCKLLCLQCGYQRDCSDP